jgi:diaminopimelate epimerase
MTVRFQKMHGAGNDFVLLDLRDQDFHIDAQIAARLADRNTGIGCDQVLVLRAPTAAGQLASFEVWNQDGSRAEQCGNGVRCLGLYLHRRSEAPSGPFKLGGPVAEVSIEHLGGEQIRVDMGSPVFTPERIPVLGRSDKGWYMINIDGKNHSLGAVSMGNPHALLIVDDLDTTDVAQLGRAISSHQIFPDGCNAGFAEILDRSHIHLRVYERGAAETAACGSGACAAVSILSMAGLVDEKVHVTQSGGSLIIKWTGGGNPVIMIGSATQVFSGILI